MYKKCDARCLLCGYHDLVEYGYVKKEVDSIHTALSPFYKTADGRLTHAFAHTIINGNGLIYVKKVT